MNMQTVYWLTRLDSIITLMEIVTTISAILTIILAFVCLVTSLEGKLKNIHLWILSAGLLITLSLGIVRTLIPTTKEACAIYLIPRITQNENIRKLPDELAELGRDWIENLKPDKGE
jgi:hypothetical protein